MINKIIRVIIKKPEDALGTVTCIQNHAESIQDIVGGPIEMIYLDGQSLLIVNEEGKLRGLAPNFKFYADVIAGPVIVAGYQDDVLSDTGLDLEEWQAMLEKVGSAME